MYLYTDTNSYPNISLSDCRIVKARLEKRDIIFEFDDMGFWVNDTHPQNPHKAFLRTDKSELRLVNANPSLTFINYHADVFFAGKKLFTKLVEVSMSDLLVNINSGRWAIDIADEYYGYKRVMLCGILHRDKPQYVADVQIEVFYDESRYYWNQICEDRTW